MRKRLMMTTAMLLLSLFTSIDMLAYSHGTFSNGVEWRFFDDGGLWISGNGEIPNFDSGNPSPWVSLSGSITELRIGNGITRIGNYSFSKDDLLKGIEKLELPASVKSIGRYAFNGSGLNKNVTLNEGLETIEDCAFYGRIFDSFTIPKTVTNIGNNIVSDTKKIVVEEGNPKYTSRDADGNECNVIIDITTKTLRRAYDVSTIPQDVEAIGDKAFFSCEFKELVLPATVKTIGKEAFERCFKLSKLTIGENVTSIGEGAFFSSGLKTLVFNGEEPPTFGTDCFKYVSSDLTVSVPADATTLAKYKAKDELKSYKFTIHGNRFYAVVDANNTLTFHYDSNLDFGTDVNVFEFANYGSAYKGTDLKNLMTDKGYSGLDYITTVDFDESVADFRPTSCAEWFKGFNKLTTINNLGRLNTEKATSMSYMFYGCSKLESLDLSTFNTEKVTGMSGMFQGCTILKSLDLSSFNTANVTDMGYMFKHCQSIESLDLRSFNTANVTTMTDMFAYVFQLKDIYVSDNFKTDNVDKYSTNSSIFNHNNFLAEGTKDAANYNTDKGNFKKVVGTLGGELIGARGKVLTIDNLTLADDKQLVLTETEPVKAAKASYSRAMTSTWGTLCLPYDIDTDDETGNCRYYAVASMTSDAITLQQLSGTIAAATPVIFCCKASNTDANISGSGVLNTTAGTNGVLVGTFETKTLDDADYFIAQDAFRLAGDYKSGSAKGVKVAPYRAYIQNLQPSVQAGSVLMILGGQVTGVSNIATDGLANAAAEYYTIDGRRTNGLQKGLNIVKIGGKTRKVIVK